MRSIISVLLIVSGIVLGGCGEVWKEMNKPCGALYPGHPYYEQCRAKYYPPQQTAPPQAVQARASDQTAPTQHTESASVLAANGNSDDLLGLYGDENLPKQEYFYFLPDHKICRGLPPPGPLTASTNCAPYSIQGNQIQIGQTSLAYQRQGNKIVLNRKPYWSLKTANQFSLSGSYMISTSSSYREWSVDPSGAHDPTGFLGGDHAIAFYPDGRFEERHFTGFSGYAAQGGQRSGSQGTYHVQDYTVWLTYANGKHDAITVFADSVDFPDGISPSASPVGIFINGQYRSRQK
jgi:hypothetical protein